MDNDLVERCKLNIANRVVAAGAVSANGHGDVSIRIPERTSMYFTPGRRSAITRSSAVVRVGLDGALREGELPPIQGADDAMHTAMYPEVPDVNCVIHTHSPYAITCGRGGASPIGCWVEALQRSGFGERRAGDGIRTARIRPGCSQHQICNHTGRARDVLLANHGVLVFHRTPELAITVLGGVVEEAARPASTLRASAGRCDSRSVARQRALQRAMTFEAQGTARA